MQEPMTQETAQHLLDVLLAAELRICREFKYCEPGQSEINLKAEIEVIKRLEHETKALLEKAEKNNG